MRSLIISAWVTAYFCYLITSPPLVTSFIFLSLQILCEKQLGVCMRVCVCVCVCVWVGGWCEIWKLNGGKPDRVEFRAVRGKLPIFPKHASSPHKGQHWILLPKSFMVSLTLLKQWISSLEYIIFSFVLLIPYSCMVPLLIGFLECSNSLTFSFYLSRSVHSGFIFFPI